MTSFDALETSVESSRPIELYQFVVGGRSFFYTSAEDEIVTPDSQEWTPESIARGKLVQGSDQSTRTVTVTMPATNPFAALYVGVPPGARGEVSIFRYQRGEVPTLATQVLLFSGVVQSVKFPNEGESAEVAVRDLASALERTVPRATFMGLCNRFLYDDGCGVDPAGHTHVGEVLSMVANVIEVDGAGASGHDFAGGYVTPSTGIDPRLVLAQSGNFLTLLVPFGSDMTGLNMQCLAGCDHRVDGDCALVYDNVERFDGFAFVPNRNPFEAGIAVPKA